MTKKKEGGEGPPPPPKPITPGPPPPPELEYSTVYHIGLQKHPRISVYWLVLVVDVVVF